MAVPADHRSEAHINADAVLAAVMETADDAIIPVKAGRGVTGWGSTAERLFSVTRAEAVGQPLDQLFSPHVRAGLRSVVARAMAGERIIHFESEVLRSDGLPLPVWVSLCPVADTDGDQWGVVTITRDITEQHLAQASLAEVEGRSAGRRGSLPCGKLAVGPADRVGAVEHRVPPDPRGGPFRVRRDPGQSPQLRAP